MANTITVSGNVGITSEGLTVNNSISWTSTMTGSNTVATIQNIPLSVWTTLDTTPLNDVRIFAATNEGSHPSGSIQIASSGSGQVIAILQQGDSIVIPWSGSVTLYAQSYTSASVLQYVVAES